MSWHYETVGWRLLAVMEHDKIFLDHEFRVGEEFRSIEAARIAASAKAEKILCEPPINLVPLKYGFIRQKAILAVELDRITERVEDPKKKRWWQ